MLDLIDLLEQFNRKERFFLIRRTLGMPEKEFRLSEKFREELGCKIGLHEDGIKIRPDAFAAMDYHLDWVAASIKAYQKCIPMDRILSETFCNTDDEKVVTGTQEDIDFLVGFKDDTERYHLIFLEAKGYTPWSNEQMNSKVNRLKTIFGCNEDKYSKITPHFCLISKSKPKGLNPDIWLPWMRKDGSEPPWMDIAVKSPRLKITRCDDGRKSSAHGGYFRIDEVRQSSQ